MYRPVFAIIFCSLFENGLFSDVTIESQHPEQQTGLVVKAHRAVLLVRVPAFWKELLTTCTVGGKDPNAFSISVEHRYLRDFIRCVTVSNISLSLCL